MNSRGYTKKGLLQVLQNNQLSTKIVLADTGISGKCKKDIGKLNLALRQQRRCLAYNNVKI